MCPDQLADEFDFFRITDTKHNNRRVTGYPITPKSVFPASVIEKQTWIGTSGRVRIDQRSSESAVELRLGLCDVELMQGHLIVSPCEIERAFHHVETLIFIHLCQRGSAGFRHSQYQVDDHFPMGWNCDGSPQ